MHRAIALLAALCLQSVAFAAEPTGAVDRPGDTYQLSVRRETETSGGISSGSSSSGGGLIERVISVRDDGVELEFDLPTYPDDEGRPRQWQFPARVLRTPDGAMTLLNRPELEARSRKWLALAKLKPTDCGRWFFTWSAFQVECDPQTALDIIASFDLRHVPLADGAPYHDKAGLAPGTLRREPNGAFVTTVAIDPNIVRREIAEAAVVKAEIMREPAATLESALRARSSDRITGSIAIRITIDPVTGDIQRVRTMDVTIKSAEGAERTVTTETMKRRRMPR